MEVCNDSVRDNAASQRMMFPVTPSAPSSSAWIRPPLCPGMGSSSSFSEASHAPLAPASITTANYTYVCQNNIIVLNSEDGHNFYTNMRN